MGPSSAEQSISASNVKITNDYVKVTAVCSCSLCEDREHHTPVFANYCPYCHSYGVLSYEEAHMWPEGIWYCTQCDADFCLVHGKEHKDPTKAYLTPYNGEIDGYMVKDGIITQEKAQNNTEVQAKTVITTEFINLTRIDNQKLQELKKAIS